MKRNKTTADPRAQKEEDAELHREVLSLRWFRFARQPAPWIVLLVSLAISAFAAHITEREVQAKQQLRFSQQVEQLMKAVESRLQAYRSLLHAGVGLLRASENITPEEWRRFHRSLDIERYYPGIQGFGYTEFVQPEDLAAYEENVRAEGFPDFSVSPAGPRDIYTAIRFLEPFDWRNQRAFGYDMFSDPVRRKAMERARDSGRATISGPVTLVQETQVNPQTGFLMYVPHYRRDQPLETVAQRREAILGYVYSPFRMNDLMAGVQPGNLSFVRFRIYDGNQAEPQALMYDSNNSYRGTEPALRILHQLDIGGRTWSFVIESTPDFEAHTANHMSLLVFAAGSLDALLLFMMTLAYLAMRSDARRASFNLARKTEAELRYRVLLDAMPTGLLAVDGEGRIRQANERAAQLFGYDQQTLLGMRVEELVPEEYRHAHRSYRSEFFQRPRQRLMGGGRELFALTREGMEVPVEIGLSPLETAGGTLTLATIVDVGERRQAREELHLLMERLTHKNREMEQFVYTVSHDLKAPLVTIGGFTQRLEESLDGVLDGQQRHWLQRIEANVQSMNQLLGDLLELSRIIHRPAELKRLDSRELVEKAVANLAGAIHESGARIEVVAELPPLYGQQQLLVQCFQNLIANGINYRRPGVTPHIEISGGYHQGEVFIEFADNGLGIEPRYHKRVFQIFERLDPESTEGTGVGLAIVNTIMDKHGGRVSLESQVGEGSTFTLCFPQRSTGPEEDQRMDEA